MNTQYTPGPWRVVRDGRKNEIVASNGDTIMGDDYYPMVSANDDDWPLIAAAPELLDALRQWAWAEANGDEKELANARRSREEAIAKAEGRE